MGIYNMMLVLDDLLSIIWSDAESASALIGFVTE